MIANANLTAAVSKLADAAGPWSSWAPAVLGGIYPLVAYYLSAHANVNRSCATRKTLEKRLRFKNRKGRAAARRLGYTWVHLRVSDVEFGSPCPFCELPRPKNDSLIRPCRSPRCAEVSGSALCPREELDLCTACGGLFRREKGACGCVASRVPA